MKKPNKIILLGTLLLNFSVGCSNEDNNKKNNLLIEKNQTKTSENLKLIDELKPIIVDKTIYSINQKKYEIDALPALYKETSGKKRKVFLELYLNYKITLESLLKEQSIYKKEIDNKIKTELDKISYRGINQNILDKTLYIQKLTLEQIALEEVSKTEENLTQQIEKIYENNKDKFKYSDTIELSFIVFKDKENAEEILVELNQGKKTIEEFAISASKHSMDRPTRLNDGYAGYMSQESAGNELFKSIWSYPKLGLINKVLEKEKKFLLLYIHKKLDSGMKNLDSLKGEIQENLLDSKRKRWIKEKYIRLMEKTEIKIYDSFENNQTF